MPHTDLQITFDTPESSIGQICQSAGLSGKEANEVYHSMDALRAWGDRFETLYGDLDSCVHHSNPDDPPDLTFHFSRGAVGVEHTRLEPSHLGWANALHHRDCPDQCITVPSITQQPRSRRELLDLMLTREGDWSDVVADLNEWFRFMIGQIRRKIEHRPDGVLVIQDVSVFHESQLHPLAEGVHALLSPRPNLIQNWTILLHSRANPVQFTSYLITGGEELQRRIQDVESGRSGV